VHQFPQQATGTVVSGFAARVLPPAVAGLAVTLAATSLTGVLTGSRWWGLVVLTTAAVVSTGVLLRWLRIPPTVVAAGQLAALVGLVTAMFTSGGWLVVLPGPAAAAQLHELLARAAQQIQVGIAPVPETTELQCLIVISIGLVAVVVDTLAVAANAPATCGLALLCVITGPAVVSSRMLPWWSFALSAVGYALVLALDSRRRQLAWGASAGSGGPVGAAPAAVAVTAGAMVVALLAGAMATAVGTDRSTGPGMRLGQPVSGIGLNPFTSLRGQLSTGNAIALFRVRGLGQRTYLRALTLSRFATGVGWQQGTLDGAVPAGEERTERLPLPTGVVTPVTGPTLRVQLEPMNYVDNWLPSFGYPLALAGIGPDWNYDPDAITIFSDRRQRAEPYTELGVLPQPDPQQLRAAGPAGSAPLRNVDPRYLDTGGVNQRVAQLAARITSGTHTAFDATVALNRWFTTPSNGFSYDLQTAPGNSGDALVDFLFTGHRGYCEQFASSMAIMLRTLGVPARVAIGFTPGTVTGDSRLITTEDAHAWVEAWFPGAGWLPFEPTPLSGGRTVTPDYVAAVTPPSGSPVPVSPPGAGTTPPGPDALATRLPKPSAGDAGGGTVGEPSPGVGSRIGLAVSWLLALGVLAGLTPVGIREGRRRRRLHLIEAGGPKAVSAAWEEVLAESADRGLAPPVGETVRASAERFALHHCLDEPGRAGLRIVVSAVELAWYAGVGPLSPSSTSENTDRELCSAVDAVRASFARCAPLSRMARLLPRSVLPGRS
jgi:transglutaminase-like putative cysteine protease